MGAPAYNTREAIKNSLPQIEVGRAPAGMDGRLEALENELRRMGEEFARMRELILDREAKGKALIDAYRDVIGDFADLFETHRNESLKRDESLRFFLGSIEGRLKTDIRNEISGGARPVSASRGWWPFGRSR